MSITGGIVLYATLWFLCLFLMLPIGHRSQDDAGDIVPGTHAGAPAEPRLKLKAIWATMLATAPAEFFLTPRNPDNRVLLGGNAINFTLAAGPPNVHDRERGRRAGKRRGGRRTVT